MAKVGSNRRYIMQEARIAVKASDDGRGSLSTGHDRAGIARATDDAAFAIVAAACEYRVGAVRHEFGKDQRYGGSLARMA